MSSIIMKGKPALINRNMPPGPQGHWLYGTMREFRSDLLPFLGELVREYGYAVRFRFILHYYGYLFAAPEHNKHILQDNNRNYTKLPHPTFALLQPLVGNGLLTNDGDSWRKQRRLIQPIFHRQRIAGFGSIITDATRSMLERWQTAVQQAQPIDVEKEMARLTLEIVGQALFSIDLTGEADTVGQAFTAVNQEIAELTTMPFSDYTIKLPFIPSTKRILRNVKVLDSVVNKIIDERRSQGHGQGADDLLAMLMEARDEETGEGMDDRQLRDEVMTLLLAGHETTANNLSWTWYLLSQYPDIMDKLQRELAEVLNGRTPTMADLPDLRYTRMIIDEAMRLYPPAYAIARWCAHEDEVGGYHVSANSFITLIPYLTHRHPDYWEDPEKFDPERFTAERSAERPRYAYIPFGGGPRQCIGNNFALTEAQLILATVAQQYRLQLKPGHPVEPEPMITLRPRYGLPMFISPHP